MARKKEKVVKAVSKWDGNALSFWGIIGLMLLVTVVAAAIGCVIAYVLGSFESFSNTTPWYEDLMDVKIALGFVAIAVFAGIGFCWACIIYGKWDTKHTIISGQRLRFKVNTLNLVLNCIKWTFFTVVTLGIYTLWMPGKIKQWQAKHTESYPEVYEDENGYSAPQITYYEYDDDEEYYEDN